ncbi:MAG: hypothetical protein R3B47_06665 [Bacteroidia bacterium]
MRFRFAASILFIFCLFHAFSFAQSPQKKFAFNGNSYSFYGRFLTGYSYGKWKVLDMRTGQSKTLFECAQDTRGEVIQSGRYYILHTWKSKELRVYNILTGKRLFEKLDTETQNFAVLPGGRFIVRMKNRYSVHDLRNGNELFSLSGIQTHTYSPIASDDGSVLVVPAYLKDENSIGVYAYSLADGKLLWKGEVKKYKEKSDNWWTRYVDGKRFVIDRSMFDFEKGFVEKLGKAAAEGYETYFQHKENLNREQNSDLDAQALVVESNTYRIERKAVGYDWKLSEKASGKELKLPSELLRMGVPAFDNSGRYFLAAKGKNLIVFDCKGRLIHREITFTKNTRPSFYGWGSGANVYYLRRFSDGLQKGIYTYYMKEVYHLRLERLEVSDEDATADVFIMEGTCVSGNCKTGRGTFAFDDGRRYEGEFRFSRPLGEGYFFYTDGKKEYIQTTIIKNNKKLIYKNGGNVRYRPDGSVEWAKSWYNNSLMAEVTDFGKGIVMVYSESQIIYPVLIEKMMELVFAEKSVEIHFKKRGWTYRGTVDRKGHYQNGKLTNAAGKTLHEGRFEPLAPLCLPVDRYYNTVFSEGTCIDGDCKNGKGTAIHKKGPGYVLLYEGDFVFREI